MKKLIYLFAFAVIFLNSCIENDDILWEKSMVEFDAATYNANSTVAGVTKDYPLLSRRPQYGRSVLTSATTSFAADTVITRTWGATNGVFRLRVNLVGAHRSEAQTISYVVVADETTAIAGTHYGTLSGKVTIPAYSSFGLVEIPILNPGAPAAGAPTSVRLVLELRGNEVLTPSPKYDRIGININQ
ncbi:DUF4843 domain-containing protein [Rufibacter radiotolerans]|uniref:DUF4843 domain-containing protein n=1 Tax=Rufibacter radiotolerans TaxID=1379910 RepID=UPI000A5CB31C|nr:DUF4843 domain-containing protein [Rufibacter radiotolerans]